MYWLNFSGVHSGGLKGVPLLLPSSTNLPDSFTCTRARRGPARQSVGRRRLSPPWREPSKSNSKPVSPGLASPHTRTSHVLVRIRRVSPPPCETRRGDRNRVSAGEWRRRTRRHTGARGGEGGLAHLEAAVVTAVVVERRVRAFHGVAQQCDHLDRRQRGAQALRRLAVVHGVRRRLLHGDHVACTAGG